MKTFVLFIVLATFGTFFVLAAMSSDNQGGVKPEEVFFPEPTNYVVDATATLKPETVNALNASLKAYDSKAQIGVAIVPTLGGLSVEEYGIKLAEKWKVGYKDKDNGIILFIAKEERKVRIEVGKGIEGDIPDAVAGRILDNIVVPALKAGDWDKAIKDGITAIQGEIK